MELGIKNDEQLVKLAQIVQRMDSGRKGGSPDEFDFSFLQNTISEDKKIGQQIESTAEESSKEGTTE